MRIMTFNTQHCASYLDGFKIDYELFSNTIRACHADVVGLNEMRGKGEDEGYDEQTEILARGAGYPHFKFAEAIKIGGKNPYGNALLSKYEITDARLIPIPAPSDQRVGARWYEDRVLLKARLSCGLTVMVIHVGLNPDEKELAVNTVLENIEDERCILMGDFNMTPDDPLMLKIRERMCDTSEGVGYTFPSDAPTRRIDYIFVTDDVNVTSTVIPNVTVSDHLPYVVDIEW